jgi:hypothetical protein
MFFKSFKKVALTATLFILSGNSHAQGPIIDVSFSDANLQACITEHAQTNDWVKTEQVTSLVCHKRNIVTLDGIEQFTNLQSLNLTFNAIEDITPVSVLTKLTGLGLSANQIKEVSSLSNLTALRGLSLKYNNINDITPLAGLNALTLLVLGYNEVSDLSQLSGLTRLRNLTLEFNQITDPSPLYPLTRLVELDLYNNDELYCSDIEALQQVLTSTNIKHNCTADILLSDITFSDANLQSCVNEYAQSKSWIYPEQMTSLVCHDKNIKTLNEYK